MSQSQVWNRSKLEAQNPTRYAVWYLPGGQFWHVLEIQRQIYLGPSPGRKLQLITEIHSKTIAKPSKIWKIKKSRKTAENIMSDQIFDVQKNSSLCWRSKSYKSLRGLAYATFDLLRQQKRFFLCIYLQVLICWNNLWCLSTDFCYMQLPAMF